MQKTAAVPTVVGHLLVALLLVFGSCAWAGAADLLATPQDLKFREFFANPVGPRGLEISTTLQAAHGRRVRLTGYMVAQEDAPSGRFFLTPLPLRMSEHADGDADDLPPSSVLVVMPAQDSVRVLPHTPGLLQLTGVLQVGRHELAGGRVAWIRLLLDPRPAALAATH